MSHVGMWSPIAASSRDTLPFFPPPPGSSCRPGTAAVTGPPQAVHERSDALDRRRRWRGHGFQWWRKTRTTGGACRERPFLSQSAAARAPVGVLGAHAPDAPDGAWQPRARRGQPGEAALTGPPTAALTGRAASRARATLAAHRWPRRGGWGPSMARERSGSAMRRPTGGGGGCRVGKRPRGRGGEPAGAGPQEAAGSSTGIGCAHTPGLPVTAGASAARRVRRAGSCGAS